MILRGVQKTLCAFFREAAFLLAYILFEKAGEALPPFFELLFQKFLDENLLGRLPGILEWLFLGKISTYKEKLAFN
ncbi:MAG: hypothetical protein UT36_C0003G0012 [Candidatus Peregrinibacteria bacterium GW2011_GWF2_39_17]|nr:MAG: hypothetical protein UT36_C0003G0012 [Candidatus Peregrinibacteria bacterium GW2011_GWF2_39_17]